LDFKVFKDPDLPSLETRSERAAVLRFFWGAEF